MATLEARISSVEARVEEHARTLGDLRELIVALDQKIDRRFDAIDRQFEAVDRQFEAVDRRFEQIDRRFEQIDRRFEAVDRRFEGFDRRFEVMDQKISKQFMWLVGVQLTALVTFAASLVGIIGMLLRR